MKYKLHIKSIILFFILIILLSSINTFLFYFNIINKYTANIISIISLIIASTTTGIYIGIKSINKAYINSSIVSSFIFIITLLFKLIITRNIKITFFLIYIIVSLLIITSSIIAINKKGNSN